MRRQKNERFRRCVSLCVRKDRMPIAAEPEKRLFDMIKKGYMSIPDVTLSGKQCRGYANKNKYSQDRQW